MNLLHQLRLQRRSFVRTLQIFHATCATWIPATYPDFMCIGAPRAATTWLHKKLRGTPQIFLPRAKELHFFDEETERSRDDHSGLRWSRSFHFDMANPAHLRWYSMQFRKGKGRTIGEITPSYSMLSQERVRLILDMIPDLKIIYIIRNPIDRAWSALRNTVSNQKGPNYNIMEDKAWLLRTIMHPQFLEGGNYRKTIETWGRMVCEQNMLYLFYDDLVKDPQSGLTKVLSFLHLDWPLTRQPSKKEKRVNVAPVFRMPAEVHLRLAQYYQEQIEYLEAKFGRDLGHWTRADA